MCFFKAFGSFLVSELANCFLMFVVYDASKNTSIDIIVAFFPLTYFITPHPLQSDQQNKCHLIQTHETIDAVLVQLSI